MLFKLVSAMDRACFSNRVVSMTSRGATAQMIESAGVPVSALGMRRGAPDPRGVSCLFRLIRREKPDVIQTWMYHADLMGGLASRLAGRREVVWNIRHTNLALEANKRTTVWTARACAFFSGLIPARIVCCSEASRRVHSGLGYDAGKMVVIPNGFDLVSFKPDTAARESVRRQLRLPPDSLLAGMIARFDPQKDHRNFIQAAARLAGSGVRVFFVLCGLGVDAANDKLAGWAGETGFADRFFFLGRRQDMPRITAALDVACLSSAGEGFPNVLGEAMACGVPCVATDAGDSAYIVGRTGRIVPPGDSAALARAMGEILGMGPEGRSRLGEAARERIRENFDLSDIVGRYQDLYLEVKR